MIPKIVVAFLCIYLQAVYGAAYSKIYVQSGPDVVPAEYVKYGVPRVVTNAQIAALSAPPIGSALPNVLAPCVAPCVIPTQTLQSVPATAKILSYNAPRVPAVVVPSNDDTSSYEYSYVVYDENTGDRKAQRELSDGAVVQGEYSFIQPDGYIREVKYTADDITGFNAVVKNFLPETDLSIDKKSPDVKNKSEPLPCKETKSEAIKVEAGKGPEAHIEPIPAKAHEPAPNSPPSEAHVELQVLPVDTTTVGTKKDVKVEHVTEPQNVPDLESHSGHFLIHINETPEEHAAHGEHPADIAIQTIPEIKTPEHPKPEDTHKKPDVHSTTQPALVETIQTPNKPDCGDHTHESEQAKSPQAVTLNGLSAYNDIIRCVQAALARKNGNAPISPLTYIILPGANKLC